MLASDRGAAFKDSRKCRLVKDDRFRIQSTIDHSKLQISLPIAAKATSTRDITAAFIHGIAGRFSERQNRGIENRLHFLADHFAPGFIVNADLELRDHS